MEIKKLLLLDTPYKDNKLEKKRAKRVRELILIHKLFSNLEVALAIKKIN